MAEIRRNVKNMFRNKCNRVFIAMEPTSLSDVKTKINQSADYANFLQLILCPLGIYGTLCCEFNYVVRI